MNVFKKIAAIVLFSSALAACGENEYVHVGENWDALNQLNSEKAGFDVIVKLKKSFMVGDEMQLSVTSPKDGKLWVIYVDPNDKVNMMFPNDFAQDNTIKAKKPIALPTSADWAIEAFEPKGHSLIAFIVTTGDTNLNDVFSQAESEGVSKALRLVRSQGDWAMEKHVVEVK
jgi:hypothetical protein